MKNSALLKPVRKIWRLVFWFFFIAGVLALGGYIYVLNHAEALLVNFIQYETKGAVELDIKKLKFNWRELRLTVLGATMQSKHSAEKNTDYLVKADTLVLELASLRPLLYGNRIQIDSIIIKKPSIAITQWKKTEKDNFSLPKQMGDAYRSLDSALNNLSIKYCLIDSGAFRLIDKTNPQSHPLVVTDYYLLIDNLQRDPIAQSSRFLFSDRVKFYSSHQHIQSMDGSHQLHYSRLRINSKRRIIELDSCFVASRSLKNSFNQFSGYFDTLRFVNVDFVKFSQENLLAADSVYCINPKVDVRTQLKSAGSKIKNSNKLVSRDSLSEAVKTLMGDFDIHYVGVVNAGISIKTKKEEKVSTYEIKRTDFSMNEVSVINKPGLPVKVGRFDLGLIGYEAIDPDSIYLIRFDSVHFLNERLQLSNFSLRPLLAVDVRGIKGIDMRSLDIKDVSWIDLLISKKLVAGEIELINPRIDLMPHENNNAEKFNHTRFFKIVNAGAKRFDVRDLTIVNAQLQYGAIAPKGFLLSGLNARLKVNHLLSSTSSEELASALTDISFEKASLNVGKGRLELNNGKLKGANQRITLASLTLTAATERYKLFCKDITIDKLRRFNDHEIVISSVKWGNARFSNVADSVKKNANTPNNSIHFHLDNIEGKSTLLDVNTLGNFIQAGINNIKLSALDWNGNGLPSFDDIQLKGDFIHFAGTKQQVHTGKYSLFHQQNSMLQDLSFQQYNGSDSISVECHEATFIPDLLSFLKKDPFVADVIINQPVISIKKLNKDKVIPPSYRPFPQFTVRQLSIRRPVIQQLELNAPFLLRLKNSIDSIHVGHATAADSFVHFRDVSTTMHDISFSQNDMEVMVSQEGLLQVKLDAIDLQKDPLSSQLHWKAGLHALQIKDGNISWVNKRKQMTNLFIPQLQGSNISISDHDFKNPKSWVMNQQNAMLQKTDLLLQTPESIFSVKEASIDFNKKSLSFDSIRFSPAWSVDSFMKKQVWQKDYLSFDAGKTMVEGMDFLSSFKDSNYRCRNIHIENARLFISKDKRLPFQHGIIKPLPIQLLDKTGVQINIDSLQLQHAGITYEELNEKNNKTGKVSFSELNVQIENLSGNAKSKMDSLKIAASGKFMDSAGMRLRYAQSYSDPLGGFSLAIRFRPFNLNVLNSVIEPLASASIRTGYLDTLRLNAIGGDSLTAGKMKMYYTGLKVKFLGNGADSSRNFKTRILTFLANDLLIKRNNRKGYGMAFAMRDHSRSFANYWLKILLSGVISSSGIRSNSKMERTYQKELLKMKIPELPEVKL